VDAGGARFAPGHVRRDKTVVRGVTQTKWRIAKSLSPEQPYARKEEQYREASIVSASIRS